MTFRPKYITFDCYGTLTYYPMHQAAYDIYEGQLPAGADATRSSRTSTTTASTRRWATGSPTWTVLHSSSSAPAESTSWPTATSTRRGSTTRCPPRRPHADVPHALTRIAKKIPLVILSNAMNEQIDSNVEKLKAPFHKVYTAQDARAYKPRSQAFEYMLDQLSCAPEDILHVSANPRYDVFTAHELGIVNKVFVNRGHERGPTTHSASPRSATSTGFRPSSDSDRTPPHHQETNHGREQATRPA